MIFFLNWKKKICLFYSSAVFCFVHSVWVICVLPARRILIHIENKIKPSKMWTKLTNKQNKREMKRTAVCMCKNDGFWCFSSYINRALALSPLSFSVFLSDSLRCVYKLSIERWYTVVSIVFEKNTSHAVEEATVC